MFNRQYGISSLVDWARSKLGIEKPTSLTLGGWEEWEEQLATNRSVAYCITETLPYWAEFPFRVVYGTINNLRNYYMNRFALRLHLLETTLPKGQYFEFGDRVLYASFTELIKFVEIEMAWKNIWCSLSDSPSIPWWVNFRILHWSSPRIKKLGLEYLQWELTLYYSDTGDINEPISKRQAEKATEILQLYLWWTVYRPIRRKRASALVELANLTIALNGKYGENWECYCGGSQIITDEEDATHEALSATIVDMEQKFIEEDTEMLLRLAKIRNECWT